MQRWIWRIQQWVLLTFGGKEDAGSGEYMEKGIWISWLIDCIRDVAAGIAILEEAGGLVTTANAPPNPATAPVTQVKLGGRLYLAIR